MALNSRTRQLAFAIGTEGTFTTGNDIAGNAAIKFHEKSLRMNVPQEFFDRIPHREQLGALKGVPGSHHVEFAFRTEITGAAVAGNAPFYGPLLRACGHSQTLNTGSASISTPARVPGQGNGTDIAPTISGTYTGTLNGILEITLIAVTTDTSAAVRYEFFPSDGSANYTTQDVTHTDGSAESINTTLAGVSCAITDPSATTSGWIIGDKWVANVTSDQTVNAVYKPVDSGIPVLDMAGYIIDEAGSSALRIRAHSCRGNMRMVYPEVGAPGYMEWRFLGILSAIADATPLASIAYPDIVPPSFKGVTETMGGATIGCFTTFEMDMNNNLTPRKCAGATTGYQRVRILGRDVKGRIDPEGVLVATRDVYADYLAGTSRAFALDVGSVSGNIIQFDAPNVQNMNITDDESDDLSIHTRELRLAQPEFDAGGDYAEYTITVL